MGLIPAGAYANRDYYSDWVKIDHKLSETVRDLMFDPQTSGTFLLIGVSSESATTLVDDLNSVGISVAAIIGEVTGAVSEGSVEFVE